MGIFLTSKHNTNGFLFDYDRIIIKLCKASLH